jgi:hypothetical protein
LIGGLHAGIMTYLSSTERCFTHEKSHFISEVAFEGLNVAQIIL